MNREQGLDRLLGALGAGLLAAGVFLNEWMLAALFSPDGTLAAQTLVKIRSFNLGAIAAGVVLAAYQGRVLRLLARVRDFLDARRQAVFRVLAVVLPFCFLELLLRVVGCNETYSERNGDGYVSAYNQVNQTPWILDSGVKRVFGFGRPEFDFEVRTNSEGIRDVEHPVPKPAGEYRIVALGDSFTMGFGAEFEDSYPRVLERNLNEGAPAGRVRVICGGVTGSDPVYDYFLLRKRLIKYRPDLVILLINETDVLEIMTRGGMDRFDQEGFLKPVEAPRYEWLFARCRLARAVMMSLLHYDHYLLGQEERAERELDTISVFAEVAASLRQLGERYGFEVLVLAQPYAGAVIEREVPGFSRRLEKALAGERVRYLDLTGFLAARLSEGRLEAEFKWPRDGHFNARGYDLLARAVENALRTYFTGEEYPWGRRPGAVNTGAPAHRGAGRLPSAAGGVAP